MSDRWKHLLWNAPIGQFEITHSGQEFCLEDGEGVVLAELEATNADDAIAESERLIIERCEATALILRRAP